MLQHSSTRLLQSSRLQPVPLKTPLHLSSSCRSPTRPCPVLQSQQHLVGSICSSRQALPAAKLISKGSVVCQAAADVAGEARSSLLLYSHGIAAAAGGSYLQSNQHSIRSDLQCMNESLFTAVT
jgi:hypothetical protein